MLADPEKVAALALVYRACHLNQHSGPDSVLVDIECCPGEISLATLAGSQLDEVDWRLIAVLETPKRLLAVARVVAQHDQLRAEALMHALPPGGRRSRRQWAAAFAGRRWRQVERAMRALRADGVTLSRDDVEGLALAAYTAGTGKTHNNYMDEYADLLFNDG